MNQWPKHWFQANRDSCGFVNSYEQQQQQEQDE